MALNIRKFLQGLGIVPKASSTINQQGEMDVTSGDGKLNYHNGTSASPMVTEAHSATLTNKTLTDNSTVIADSTDASKQIKFDAGGTASTATTITAAQTANRTLTLPDATDTLIGRVTADTGANRVKNKDLEDTTTSIVNTTDTSKKIKFDPSGNTTGKTLTLKGNQTNDYTIEFPNALPINGPAEVTLTTATQTLIQKTIDTADQNIIRINGNTLNATNSGPATINIPLTQLVLSFFFGTFVLVPCPCTGGILHPLEDHRVTPLHFTKPPLLLMPIAASLADSGVKNIGPCLWGVRTVQCRRASMEFNSRQSQQKPFNVSSRSSKSAPQSRQCMYRIIVRSPVIVGKQNKKQHQLQKKAEEQGTAQSYAENCCNEPIEHKCLRKKNASPHSYYTP